MIFSPITCFFLISYLAAPRLTLDHCRGRNLDHQILITVFFLVHPKVTTNLVTILGRKARPSASVEFKAETLYDSECNKLSHCFTLPKKIISNSISQKNPLNMFQIVRFQEAYKSFLSHWSSMLMSNIDSKVCLSHSY